MKIEMKERPRCSGKTTGLRLKILEDILQAKYDKVVIIVHSLMQEREYKTWLVQNNFNVFDGKISVVFTVDSLKDSLRGFTGINNGVYIDEPYLFDRRKQAEFLDALEFSAHRNSINIYGIGTKPERYVTFEDYLD